MEHCIDIVLFGRMEAPVLGLKVCIEHESKVSYSYIYLLKYSIATT
jgi:hypothetical protein